MGPPPDPATEKPMLVVPVDGMVDGVMVIAVVAVNAITVTLAVFEVEAA